MKMQIKEDLRLTAYPETTSVNASVKKCDTKGAKKRTRSAVSDSSTVREPSHWEHIDRQFPDSQGSQSKPSRPKRRLLALVIHLHFQHPAKEFVIFGICHISCIHILRLLLMWNRTFTVDFGL
jgi:hypothetical protein